MSDKKGESEWNFELKGVKTQEENIERQNRKARLAEKLNQKEEKRDAQKDLMGSRAKEMTLDAPTSSRKSRTKLAQDMRKEDQPEISDFVAGPIKRGLSFLIDAAIFGAIVFFVDSLWKNIEFQILLFFRENGINQMLEPSTFKMIVISILCATFYAFFMALPVCFSRKSWGKSLTKLSIESSDENIKIGFSKLFFREFIAKPVSIATVVGPLLCLINKERRGLHDMISGTIVMDDNL